MTTFQIVVDCAEPDPLARFWAVALGYVLEPAPEGYDDWDAYWREVGVPEDELGQGADSIVDPTGAGPRIWFQQVPEPKSVKNRLHLDVRASRGRADALPARRAAIDARVTELVALGATRLRVLSTDGLDHYGVTLHDPEGNEFCIN